MAREIRWKMKAGPELVVAQGHIKDQHDTREALARFGERILTALEAHLADAIPFGDELIVITACLSEEKPRPGPEKDKRE